MNKTRTITPVCILMLGLMCSCASLKPSTTENQVGMANPAEIEGNYTNVSANNSGYRYNDFKKIIDHRDKIKSADSIISVDIKIVDDRNIRFTFVDRKENRYAYSSRYRFDDGKITLQNRNFRLTGIPYLLGGYKINKSELSLTSDRNLVVRSVAVDEGAILFVLPASIPKSNFENVYLKNTK